MSTPAIPDLITWLRACLDDDEQWARGILVPPANWRESGVTDAVVAGLARRMLVEVDAKRRILDAHPTVPEDWATEIAGDCRTCSEPNPCPTLRLLALPYADRPGYREEWRPHCPTPRSRSRGTGRDLG